MTFTIFESPFGALTLTGGPGELTGLYFPGTAPTLRAAEHDA